MSKDAAKVSETNAKKSEANAEVSETNAKESELKAKQYADHATAGQLQADWKQTDSTKKDFIKNKPTLGTLSAKNSLAYSELTGVPTSFTPSSHTHPISQITNLQASLDAKTNDATLQVDLTAIRESITNVSSKVDGIGDTLSPTYAKKQAILDACDKALNGTNPVNAVDPTFINQLAEKLSKLGTVRPLGFHYLHPYGTVPADSIICNGATYSRALYKDFFDYITTQGWVKTEAEWQEIATRDNGFCPFYSDGDGSTNFRTPKFAPYQQIAMKVATATTYHEAGLPDLNGDILSWLSLDEGKTATGVFKNSIKKSTEWTGLSSSWGEVITTIRFKASDYSPVYGRTSTVQPESHEWVMCVVAYGIATNVGSVDIQNVMSAVNAVQARVDNKLEVSTVHITETWKSTDGNSWYRKWSDGFIEQGGKISNGNAWTWYTATLNTPFTKTSYTLVVVGVYVTDATSASGQENNDYFLGKKSTNSFRYRQLGDVNDPTADWYACGY